MTTSAFIEKQKNLYKTLKPCFCPAIQTVVNFNSDGLNHLLYDKHRPRNHKHKHYRMALVDYLTEVISKSKKAVQESFANPPCVLYILDWVTVKDECGNTHNVKVILKKNGNGNIHFWSVMQKREKQTKKPKK